MKYPATGLSSMDQIMVSIEWDPAYSDDQVILIGEIDGHAITVQYRDEWAASGK
jgi:alanine racemase